jgi:catechol 2,3-dioxygenase-like lactoylglutathione lyase family enzyme
MRCLLESQADPATFCLRMSAILLLPFVSGARAQTPLLSGLDHIPVVVADIDRAQADFRAMGFAIKPGRFHANGIRNAHVKFLDGTEIELITATNATDELTSEYLAKLKTGEGPVYFGLYAPDRDTVGMRLKDLRVPAQEDNGMFTFPSTSPLHSLFLGQRNKTPTDKPEYFAHPNSATRLSALWVRDSRQLRDVLEDMWVPLTPMTPCGVLGIASGVRASLPEGDVFLIPSDTANVVAARVEVRKLSEVEAVLKASGVQTKKDSSCGTEAVWVAPANGHGIWIEFAERDRTERAGTTSHLRGSVRP